MNWHLCMQAARGKESPHPKKLWLHIKKGFLFHVNDNRKPFLWSQIFLGVRPVEMIDNFCHSRSVSIQIFPVVVQEHDKIGSGAKTINPFPNVLNL